MHFGHGVAVDVAALPVAEGGVIEKVSFAEAVLSDGLAPMTR
jgi:hypothetical protein